MSDNYDYLQELLAKEAEGSLKAAGRMKIPPQEMPQQDPDIRRENVEEVATGYGETEARIEAMRCLRCKNQPCVKGCPVGIEIRDFVSEIAAGEYDKALDIIKQNSLLPAVCGRVCPQESQCQLYCTVGKSLKDPMKSVAIGRLERFVADRALGKGHAPAVAPETGKKVAIIGSGPGGIVAAADCRRAGHQVTMFEAFHKPGGVLIYGIPEFRLPKKLVAEEIKTLKDMGVDIICNFVVGKTRTVQELMEKDGFDAVYIGVGAGLPKFMRIDGEMLIGVYSANEYLTRANLMKAYAFGEGADTPITVGKNVAVIGGGNVAMDAARTALRLGADNVYLIYRRSEAEMPARLEEVHHAKEEGIKFMTLHNPVRFIGDENDRLKQVECLQYELGEPDESGRRRPVPIEGSEMIIDIDVAVVAIGNSSNPLLRETTPGLKFNKWGNIEVDEACATSLPGVFAGGDIVLGAATVILAMGQGRIAAKAIDEYLKQ
jgi:glutamate synthase (NADPH/NADH) small chain